MPNHLFQLSVYHLEIPTTTQMSSLKVNACKFVFFDKYLLS